MACDLEEVFCFLEPLLRLFARPRSSPRCSRCDDLRPSSQSLVCKTLAHCSAHREERTARCDNAMELALVAHLPVPTRLGSVRGCSTLQEEPALRATSDAADKHWCQRVCLAGSCSSAVVDGETGDILEGSRDGGSLCVYETVAGDGCLLLSTIFAVVHVPFLAPPARGSCSHEALANRVLPFAALPPLLSI